ncbi:hypothetical protein AB1L42_08890 [Thalassoglobus sp. JC818]|uniref:hypothetical protein n=1 Tax=Thalassoglobus sp. JC818 TaxID=3232136 RepID=UPI00345A6CDD
MRGNTNSTIYPVLAAIPETPVIAQGAKLKGTGMMSTLITIDQNETKRKLKAYRSRMHKDAAEEYTLLIEI